MWTLNFDSGSGQSRSASSVRSVPTTQFGYAYGSDRTSHTSSGVAVTWISFFAIRRRLPGGDALDAALEVLDRPAEQRVLDHPCHGAGDEPARIEVDLDDGPGAARGRFEAPARREVAERPVEVGRVDAV